jgi:hypothetical protein
MLNGVGLRQISAAVFSERIVHRAERVPNWRANSGAPPWRALCGVPVGGTRDGGMFEFAVAVALEPEAWRLAANCSDCLAATERRELATLGHPSPSGT